MIKKLIYLVILSLVFSSTARSQLGPSQPVILCNPDASICLNSPILDSSLTILHSDLLSIQTLLTSRIGAIGRQPAANSTPVVIAPDQTPIPVIPRMGPITSATRTTASDFWTVDMTDYPYGILEFTTTGTPGIWQLAILTSTTSPVITGIAANANIVDVNFSGIGNLISNFAGNCPCFLVGVQRFVKAYLQIITGGATGSVTLSITPTFQTPPTVGNLLVRQGTGASTGPSPGAGWETKLRLYNLMASPATPTRITVGVTAVDALITYNQRKYAIIQNVGTTTIYLGFGTTAPTTTTYVIALAPGAIADDGLGGVFESQYWAGQIQAISSAAGGAIVVTNVFE